MATEQFQISAEQAEAYEDRFVPALFRQWVEPVLEAAELGPGSRVLDVACGTGVVARAASEQVSPGGRVTGVDLNPAMLAVAERVAPGIEWREGDVASLPFDADAFDVVTCQAAIFFFPDPAGALREMGRVTRSGGRVVVQSFAALSSQPAYGPWVELVARHAGPDAVRLLGTYWSEGDPDAMRARCADAGLRVIAVHEHVRPAYFPNIETMVLTEVNATPLRDRLDQAHLERILAESRDVLGEFVRDGRLVVPLAGFVLAAEPV
ncbi:methyltransferase domain-containing protein [Nocardioides sp.]|uniref:methyltransferase domain-containing protein n=1 Tax=Nocardioides sp. TaxID=35761 RepID=UPI002ED5195D